MQVLPQQIHRSHYAVYSLWDGEMVVHVHRHIGLHGYASVVMVVSRVDNPLDTRSNSWYGHQPRMSLAAAEIAMDEWVAERLTMLSQGYALAAGTECEVTGLKQM